MNYKVASTVTAILTACAAQAAQAQTAEAPVGIEEVTVTATRRSESLQDVPIAITALTGETLSQLNVSTIDDYIKYLPSVSMAARGPGEGVVYMRGLSVGALGTQGQASVGGWPNVAVYLDEQSTQIPGRNLDVYAADLERIEVLEGPQGTLFGAGAQAGVLRYITNKPKLDVTEGKVSGSYSTTAHGADNSGAEAVFNIPLISNKMALRAVIYNESRGGYIDNVGSTFTRQPTDNGIADRTCNAGTGGTTGVPCDVDRDASTPGTVPADSIVIDNFRIAKDDINGVTYKGLRVGLAYQVNDDWDVLLTQSYQDMNSSGVFYQLPNGSEGQPLKDLEVTLFNDTSISDKFSNTALTINGQLGVLGVMYSGAYLTRESRQIADYTNYARGVWASYYQCTGFSGDSVDKCYSPSSTWHDTTKNINQSHELRFTTPSEWRLRAIGGLFWEQRELNDETEWLYKSVPECSVGGPSSCFLWLDPLAAPKFQSASVNNPNRRNPATGFFDDFQRTFRQKAAYLSLDYDLIPEVLTITAGTRYYEQSNNMLGANMGSFYCKVYGTGETGPCTGALYGYGDVTAPYGTNLDEQDPHSDSVSDFKSRANISWNVTPDVMVYATWSEGFRMGGFNRGFAAFLPDPDPANRDAGGNARNQYFRPKQYASDELTNYELGWKTQLLDNRLQINGAVYREEWKNVQTGIFAPQLGLGNLTAGLNGPEYEVNGIELQFVAQLTDGLTIQGSASYNDSKLVNSPALIDNNPDSLGFGQPITSTCLAFENPSPPLGACVTEVPVENIFGERGDPLANSPKYQANLRARYEWDRGEYRVFWQVGGVYQSSSLSEATKSNQFTMPSWTTYDASVGIAKDQWSLELQGANLTDENKSLFTTNRQFILAETPMRPRTLGLRFAYRFGD